MKFNFKKIASAASSLALIGSTAALAMAANYPAPFVDNGVANVGIVYGTSANLDIPASVNIQTSLSEALAAQGGGGGGVVFDGDAYALFTGSSPIQLNTSINSVRATVTESNLPSVLADTEFTATSDGSDDSSITATFKLEIGSNPRAVFAKEPTSSDDPSLGVQIGTTAANFLYNSTITFSKDVNFSDSDSEGNSLTLFGKKFTIASATDETNLVLFESAEKIFLDSESNPSEVVTVNDKAYTIELISASDSAATIRVTDSDGNSDLEEINEAASRKILGIEVAVDKADETNFKLSASVILGASRIKMTDGSEVLMGTEETVIEGTQVGFVGGSVDNMKKLTVAVFAPDGSNDFFKAGTSWEDPVFGGFKIDFAALTNDDEREEISISTSGNDKMVVSFTNWQDKSVTNFAWLNNESSAWGRSFLGDASDWQLFVRESARINESGMAVVGNEEDAHLVRLVSLSNVTGTSGESKEYSSDIVKFENVFDTSETWQASIDSEGAGTIDIGGLSYTVSYWDDKDGDKDEHVQLKYPDSSSNEIVAYPVIQTASGAKLMFYEPLLINLSDAHDDLKNSVLNAGAWRNVTAIKIPDGDGYTDITVADGGAAGNAGMKLPTNYTVTVGGGTATNLDTNVTSIASGLIGPLNWTLKSGTSLVPGGPFAVNHTAWLYLTDVDGSTAITNPAIIVLEEQDEDNNYNAVIMRMGGAGNSDNGVGVSDVDFTWNGDIDMAASAGSTYGSSGLQRESNDKLYDMMDRWGTMVTTDQSTSDQYTAVISYPNNQISAEIYASEGSASSSSSGNLGTVLFTDDQISQVSGNNLIVVGGSCINTVAASLLGSDSPICGPNFESATGVGSGSFLIQSFESPFASGKIATLVAGYEAGDTTNAATYLTTETVDTTAGMKYIGTSGTEATLQTA